MKNIFRIAAFVLAALAAPLVHAGSFGGEKFVSTDPTVGAQFPEIAYYNGVIHVVFVGFPSGSPGGQAYYARSTAATGTFSAPVSLSAGVSSTVDRVHVTAGPNGVVVGWDSDGTTGAIYSRRSADGGVTWQAAQLVAGAEGDGFYHRLTQVFTDSFGQVHMAYYTNADNAGVSGMVHHRMSCDGGASWATDTAVNTQALDGELDNEQPRLAQAGGGGAFWIVFRSTRNGHPQGGWAPFNIIAQRGTLSGCAVVWSYPGRRVANGIPLSLASSYRPEIFGDANGNLHFTWWENTFGANVAYRQGFLLGNPLGAPQLVSNFDVNHMEPGSVSTTGGYQQPATFVSNATTAFIGYSRNTQSTNNLENGVVLLRESTTNGATWGAEQTIATSGAGASPRFAIDNANTQNVGIVWTDLGGGTGRVKYRLYTLGALSGGPSLSIAPDPLAFGDKQVGVATSLSVTVTNSGGAGTISGVAITGLRTSDYQITSNTCGAIAGGGQCTVQVTFTPQALGSRPANLTVTSDSPDSPTTASLTGNGVAGSAANNVAAVVTGYYETILGRSPDAGGKSFWINEANRVTALGPSVREVFFAMSLEFFNSPEYTVRNTSNTQYITDLYRTFFIREPDAGGLSFWNNYLNQGVDRGALLTNFLFSAEFNAFMNNLFGPPAVRAEVDMTIDFFRGLLGRLPDNGGFNFWLSQLRTAQCQGAAAVSAKAAELAQLFAESGEYATRDAARAPGDRNRMYVGDLYNAFLRRGAEPSGYNFWVNQINSGAMNRAQVRVAFVNSSEFQARVNAVIAQGCLP